MLYERRKGEEKVSLPQVDHPANEGEEGTLCLASLFYSFQL